MNTPQTPTNPHEFAKWLLEALELKTPFNGGVRGYLPNSVDWNIVERAQAQWKNLFGWCSQTDRQVELHPQSVGVFESLDALLQIALHQRNPPNRYSLLQEQYDSDTSQNPPPEIIRYHQAVKLSSVLSRAADVVDSTGERLQFIKGHEARIAVRLTYTKNDLVDIPGMDAWMRDFVDTGLHQEQKRTLLRQSLLDLFKGHAEITLGQLLPRFAELDAAVRASYAMYMAEFTFEKVKAEVEKDNLDSSIKIGKAVSDIQNQLLAMPVALLLAGGQMEPHLSVKNIVLMLGSVAFAWLMNLLINNQKASLNSIKIEIDSRKKKIEDQPKEVFGRLQNGFDDLHARVAKQGKNLGHLDRMVALGLLCTLLAFLWFTLR